MRIRIWESFIFVVIPRQTCVTPRSCTARHEKATAPITAIPLPPILQYLRLDFLAREFRLHHVQLDIYKIIFITLYATSQKNKTKKHKRTSQLGLEPIFYR